MKTVLFYFTGTGNTLYLTKVVQGKTSARIVGIVSTMKKEEFEVEEDAIGIITPVYYADLPNIVQNFLKCLKNIENKYIFLICNYGGGKGDSLKTANIILKQNGGEVSLFYGIHMTQNAFRKPFEDPMVLSKRADRKLSNIDKYINERYKGNIVSSKTLDTIQNVLNPILRPLSRKYLVKVANLNKNADIEEAIYKSDMSFFTDNNCTGCGNCANVCPVNNIRIINGHPEWLHHCENCLACYNWCPIQAIHGEVMHEGYYYRHPELQLEDMIRQK